MKLAQVNIFQYELPLTRALTINSDNMSRHGFIVEISNESDRIGYGECAPLPGFSTETLNDAQDQLTQIAFSIAGTTLPANLDELSGGFEQWLGKYKTSPSVRFAVESAVICLIAANEGISLSQLLSSEAASVLPVNALLAGNRDEVIEATKRYVDKGYTTFKLKVGSRKIRDDIGLTAVVRDIIGDTCGLRLDANRQWDVRQAIDFWAAVDALGIEYIEEPVADHAALVKELTKVGLPSLISMMLPPTALDESILNIDPDTFDAPPGVKAIILKPTLLGLERAMRWARKAIRKGLTPVVTSTYESSIGIATLAHFAASLSPTPAPMGLATLDVFENDLLEPVVAIENGSIELTKLPDVSTSIKRELLARVSSHG